MAKEVRALGFTMPVVDQAGPDVPTLDLLAYAIDPDGWFALDPRHALLRSIEDDAVLLQAALHAGELDCLQLERYLRTIQRKAAVGAELVRRCVATAEEAAGASEEEGARTLRSAPPLRPTPSHHGGPAMPSSPVRLVPPQGSTG
jgi:hypothetical protein